MKDYRAPRRAFTLVELLVVIAIIGILIALTLPAINGAREVTRRALCGGNLRQFFYALNAYDLDQRALPPGGWNYGNTLNSDTHSVLRKDYNVPAKLTVCPSAARLTTSPINWNVSSARIHLTYWYLAGNAGRPSSAGSEENGWLTSVFPSRGAGLFPPLSLNRPYSYPTNKVETWKQPIIADIAYWRVGGGAPATATYRANHVDVTDDYNAVGQNVLFVDGHAEWQVPALGRTWKYYGALYVNAGMWMTSNYAPPASPNVFYFN